MINTLAYFDKELYTTVKKFYNIGSLPSQNFLLLLKTNKTVYYEIDYITLFITVIIKQFALNTSSLLPKIDLENTLKHYN